jgi:hypothetical protein
MNEGHLDAQNYRFDFVEVVINEMVSKYKTNDTKDEDNETKMKRLFDGK